MSAHWSVQTNHHTHEARVARPFSLAYKPQHIEWGRGMGLAGQTSASVYVNVFSNILLYVHVPYIHELNSVQSNYCKGSIFVIKRLGEHLQLDHLRFVVAVQFK